MMLKKNIFFVVLFVCCIAVLLSLIYGSFSKSNVKYFLNAQIVDVFSSHYDIYDFKISTYKKIEIKYMEDNDFYKKGDTDIIYLEMNWLAKDLFEKQLLKKGVKIESLAHKKNNKTYIYDMHYEDFNVSEDK